MKNKNFFFLSDRPRVSQVRHFINFIFLLCWRNLIKRAQERRDLPRNIFVEKKISRKISKKSTCPIFFVGKKMYWLKWKGFQEMRNKILTQKINQIDFLLSGDIFLLKTKNGRWIYIYFEPQSDHLTFHDECYFFDGWGEN